VWPFGKKKQHPPKAEIVVGHAWQVADGEYQGLPMITSFNLFYKELAGHPEYRHQVGIAVPLTNPSPSGLPDQAELAQLVAIEQTIRPPLEKDNISLFTGRITTKGMREFIFYTSDPESVKSTFADLQRQVQTHQL
jgi:hypothetical protein